MLLSHLLKEPYTEPKNYTMIFERGIDPHVDDPDHCHSHSEVPERDEDWPTLEDILAYRDRVRARLMSVYDDIDAGRRKLDRTLARVLQMTLEHEGFHIEVTDALAFYQRWILNFVPDTPLHAHPTCRYRYPPATGIPCASLP